LFFLVRGRHDHRYQMLTVAVGWQVYALTSSAFDLGLIGLVQFLPAVLLLLFAGHVAIVMTAGASRASARPVKRSLRCCWPRAA